MSTDASTNVSITASITTSSTARRPAPSSTAALAEDGVAARNPNPGLRAASALLLCAFCGAAAAQAAATSAPVPDKGDVAFLTWATASVLMMCVPGLALFYGGMVRAKNLLSMLMQVFSVVALITVLWVVYGYSLAFTAGNPVIGGVDKLMLTGVTPSSLAATFSKAVVLPELSFVAFQGSFAAITCALVVGAFAERARFAAVLAFCALWFTFSYLPAAHMVWYWDGPDAIRDAASLAEVQARAGWLWTRGALDFAGGTVVHINAAVAALIAAWRIGPRLGHGREAMAPHNLTLTMVGAGLLWVGWCGFNAGSNLEANGTAALALVNTFVATAAAALAWSVAERLWKGKASLLGGVSGAVSGLVAVTPACGFVGVGGALVLGALAGLVGLWGVHGLKRALGVDDSLDVFGIHGVCGIFGAVATGVLAAPGWGGTGTCDYAADRCGAWSGTLAQLAVQAEAVLVTVLLSAAVSLLALELVKRTLGLRVTAEQEREGLDTARHGERAYG